MLSIFSSAMELLENSFTELVAVVHVAPNRHVEEYICKIVDAWPVPVVLVPGGSSLVKYDAFAASRVALCTSGTVALELQLAQLPCVVAYRAHLLTELFILYKAKISYISLPNILMESPIIPEALFTACTPSKLASLLLDLIDNESLREKQTAAAEKVIQLLCPPKPSAGDSRPKDPNFVFSNNNTPSSIAAHTLLYTPIQRNRY